LNSLQKKSNSSQILASLRWFPVTFRIDFKVLLIVFKALPGQAPSYIRDLLTCYKPDRCLRSFAKNLLVVPDLVTSLKLTGLSCSYPDIMEFPAGGSNTA
ncbi:hypothetical protein LDENG_00059300, partial [Lucifuga dentata]